MGVSGNVNADHNTFQGNRNEQHHDHKKYGIHSMRHRLSGYAQGFTLLEIIITLTVTAILSTMIFTYFGKAFTESVTPISRLKKSAYLQKIMQNITADFNYNGYPKWSANTAYSLNTVVIPISRNGRSYRCINAGTSGATEPVWIIGTGNNTKDGSSLIWTDNDSPLAVTALKTRVAISGNYKSLSSEPDYIVAENKCIEFDTAYNELTAEDTSCAKKTLKVTLMNENGETLTSLFITK